MVFQHFNLYPTKLFLKNVTLAPIKVLGISKAEAEKTAEKFLRTLTCGTRKTLTDMLSGGQKQRIAMPVVLPNPELLLLTNQRQPLTQRLSVMLAVMENLAKGGMNMVVVTHEMAFARSVADRIIFMAEGHSC